MKGSCCEEEKQEKGKVVSMDMNEDMNEYLDPVVFVITGRNLNEYKTYTGIYEPKARVDDFYIHASREERRKALARMPDYQPPPLPHN
jgi:hypothetical protein